MNDIARRLALVATAILFGGCGSSPADPQGEGPQLATVPVQIGAAPALATLVVEVTAADLSAPLAFNLTLVAGSASDTITIPAGSNRTITVRGFDGAAIETHRGSITRNLVEGINPTVTVTLLPLSGQQPIVIVLGALDVEVTPIEDTVAVGSTIQLSAVITDDSGDTLNVTPNWASLSPAIASVDGTGVVTGVSVGRAQIVATFGGVGAAAAVVAEWVPASLLHFDGVDDYVQVPQLLFAGGQTSSFTIELWLRSGNATQSPGFVFGKASTWAEVNITYNNGELGAFYAFPNPQAYWTGLAAGSLDALTWTHLAWVKSGTEERWYVNGQLEDAVTGNTLIDWSASQQNFRLASGLEGAVQSFWQGDIAGLRVSSSARYDDDFYPPPISADLATELAYDFKEGTGASLTDLSGKGNDGVIVGASWVVN